jgi:hypothetical protein
VPIVRLANEAEFVDPYCLNTVVVSVAKVKDLLFGV